MTIFLALALLIAINVAIWKHLKHREAESRVTEWKNLYDMLENDLENTRKRYWKLFHESEKLRK
jgi:hypothetical protein